MKSLSLRTLLKLYKAGLLDSQGPRDGPTRQPLDWYGTQLARSLFTLGVSWALSCPSNSIVSGQPPAMVKDY